MIEKVIYPAAELPAHLKWQILSFIRVEWPDGFVGANQYRDWITEEGVHPVHVMLVAGDLLVSQVEVVWKYLDHAGETYKTYGLTGVLTYPSFRGQGYGKQVVDAGTEYIRTTDADIGLFHCHPRVADFYAKSGWQPMKDAITHKGDPDAPTVSEETMMMQFYTDKGRRGWAAFETQPVYFGIDTW